MSAESLLSPAPICEVCWLKARSRWEPHSMDDDGNIKMILAGVDVPQKLNTGSVETCTECGKITIAGIFDLRNPKIEFTVAENLNEDVEEYYGEDSEEF